MSKFSEEIQQTPDLHQVQRKLDAASDTEICGIYTRKGVRDLIKLHHPDVVEDTYKEVSALILERLIEILNKFNPPKTIIPLRTSEDDIQSDFIALQNRLENTIPSEQTDIFFKKIMEDLEKIEPLNGNTLSEIKKSFLEKIARIICENFENINCISQDKTSFIKSVKQLEKIETAYKHPLIWAKDRIAKKRVEDLKNNFLDIATILQSNDDFTSVIQELIDIEKYIVESFSIPEEIITKRAEGIYDKMNLEIDRFGIFNFKRKKKIREQAIQKIKTLEKKYQLDLSKWIK